MNRRLIGLPLCSGLLAAALVLAGAESASAQVEIPLNRVPPAATADPGKAAAAKDPFAVPDGPPEAILKYLETLQDVRPEKTDEASVVQFRDKLLQALLTASDKLIAGKPNEEQYEVAVQVRVSALMTMKQLGDAAAQKKLDDLLADLEKAGKTKLLKGVRGMLLMARMERLFTASVEDQKKFVSDVKNLAGAAAAPEDASLMMRAVMTIEATGNMELAAAAYRDFAKLFAASKEKQIQDLAPKLEGAANRMELVGKKLDLEGNFLDGKPLKWEDYRGKIVLVEFWATWCGPCRMELPHIKQNYQAYHGKGFDVVAVSVDDDKRAVEAYVKEQTIPWPIVFSDSPDQRGFNSPLTTKLGVFGVPCSLLVDKEGKVLSLQARGPALRRELEKLLGPPAIDPSELPMPGFPGLPAAPAAPKKTS